MLQRKLLAAALRDRGAYDAILATPEPAQFSDGLDKLWARVREFYERDPEATRVDVDVVSAALATGALNPKRARADVELLGSISTEDVSVENIKHYLHECVLERTGMALAAALAGRRPTDEVRAALSDYEAAIAVEDSEEDPAEQDWGAVLRAGIDRSNRIPLSPRVLNQYLAGGVLPGHNITIFGRPESGKTALALTMACGFARQGKRVLYIGNEDPVRDLMMRVLCNLTNATVDEIAADPDRAEELALSKGAGNLFMRELAPGSVPQIEALIKQHKPQVLFVDQLRNINSGKSDNYTQLLDKNAQAIRALGKRYGMVTVSVTQAGDSASGRSVLEMGDVDSSNTGIPGAADLMIGVGVTQALDAAGQRMLSLCKNKPGGVKATVPVSLDPFRSKMK